MGGCFGCFRYGDDDVVGQSKHTSEIDPTYFEKFRGDPNIDKKADEFIAKFHESCDKGAEYGAMAEKASIGAFKLCLRVPAMKADEVVKFYEAAFGAERMNHLKLKAEQELPSRLCAELIKIGSFFLLICDQTEDSSAPTGEGAIVFRMETEDVEGAVEKAVKAGAELLGENTEEEGARGRGLVAKVKDPFGVVWHIASDSKK